MSWSVTSSPEEGLYYVINDSTGDVENTFDTYEQAAASVDNLNSTFEPSQATEESDEAENLSPEDQDRKNEELFKNAEERTSSVSSNSTGSSTTKADPYKLADNLFKGTGTNNVITPKVNPLSYFSSYTYKISFYMVTMNAYNTFIKTGTMSGLKGNDGVFVIAQSGGINNQAETRALAIDRKIGKGKEGYDYFIDDLNMTTFFPGGSSKASVSTEIKFKVTEITSLSFITDLAKASAQVDAMNKVPDIYAPSMFNQHFIIGVKFQGYDVDGNPTMGNPATGSEQPMERYLAIRINKVNFKLQGKATVYDISALVVAEQVAYGKLNGTVKNPITMMGRTVKDVLSGGGKDSRGLAQIINENTSAQKDRKNIGIEHKISFKFLDESGKEDTSSAIANSALLDDSQFAKEYAPVTAGQTTDKTSISDSFKAVSYDRSKTQVPVTYGTPILTVIDNIIVKSKYVTDALNKVKESDESDADTKTKKSLKTLRWYTVNPVVTALGMDKETRQWAYDITYQIKPYDISYVRTTNTDAVCKYPGPFKMYNYWLTGKNTEIISYEQQYNNLYYVTSSITTNVEKDTKEVAGRAPRGRENAANSDPNGAPKNDASRINDEVRAQLYSPADQTHITLTIMGDPDYIITTTGVQDSSASKFFGKDSSINPFGSQAFIQIVFNSAEDYNDQGVLDVSDRLQFYRTDRVKKAKIDGLVYMVVKVDSVFAKGAFRQVLTLQMVEEEALVSGTFDGVEAAYQRDFNDLLPSVGEAVKKVSASIKSGVATIFSSSNKSSAVGGNTAETNTVSAEVRTTDTDQTPPPESTAEETTTTTQAPENNNIDDDATVYRETSNTSGYGEENDPRAFG